MVAEQTAYLAPEGFVGELVRELGDVIETHGRLVIAPGPARDRAWAQNVWAAPERLRVRSVKGAARELRRRGRDWALYAFQLHRRAKLIAEELPSPPEPVLRFPEEPPASRPGSWTVLGEHELLVSTDCTSPFPNGEVRFVEDHQGPPSRAYLKLWEALTRLGAHPGPGERCVDLGASPGGWTWACAQLGASVLAVDKAPLDPSVASLPRVEAREDSAFAIDPRAVGPTDWLLSDVACYPARLLSLVRRWLEAGAARRMICTVKLQGEPDPGPLRALAAIEGARLMHLCHNRHELTWVHPGLEGAAWRW